MPPQYPGEFVPIILWVGGVAGASLAAHEANKSAEPAAHKIDNQYNCRRLIKLHHFFLAHANVKRFLADASFGFLYFKLFLGCARMMKENYLHR
jgi:hypothetical protein